MQASNGFIKLGMSTNLRERLKQLQSWAPFKLRIVAHFKVPRRGRRPSWEYSSERDDASMLEGIVMAVLDPWRVGGEWFRGEPESISIIAGWIRTRRLPRRPKGLTGVRYTDARRKWLRAYFAKKRGAA